MDIIPRHLAATVVRVLRAARVINVVGPRQAGKTTLVRDMVEAASFLNLDDDTLLASLTLDPFGQLSASSFPLPCERHGVYRSEH
jgi:uncharacterized protein